MSVDLHTHSTASDGSDPPSRLIELAARQGLMAIALTDHDTQEGWAEAEATARVLDIELVPGVELSAQHSPGSMHLVVLWLTPGAGPLQDRLAELQHGRHDRNTRIVANLAALGMPITVAEVDEEAGGGSVGRPHIAAVMTRQGYVPDLRPAFDLWLGSTRPAYADRPRLDPKEAIGLARESGAVPVLAHPHTLGINTAAEMADLLTDLRGWGLVGLEAVYSAYRRHERDGYAHLARRFGLIPSGGSDYHGLYKPGLELGRGFGDLVVPDSLLDELHSHAGSS